MSRAIPKVRVRRNVANQSSRNGAPIRLIVMHSTEGANVPGLGDLVGLGGWFANPAAQASSHVGVDAEGNSARFVRDQAKAWTQAYWNPWSLSVECVGRAAQTSWTEAQEREVARWVAYWSERHRVPIQKAKVDLARGVILRPGVIRHSELGQLGGGHHDPGKGFDLAHVLSLAKGFKRRL